MNSFDVQDLTRRAMSLMLSPSPEQVVGARASNTGWCPRRVVLEMMGRGKNSSNERSELRMLNGNLIHDWLDKAFKRLIWSNGGKDWVSIQPFQMTCYKSDTLFVPGTADVILLCPDRVVIIDFKSAGKFAMKNVRTGIKRHHQMQLGAYCEGFLNSFLPEVLSQTVRPFRNQPRIEVPMPIEGHIMNVNRDDMGDTHAQFEVIVTSDQQMDVAFNRYVGCGFTVGSNERQIGTKPISGKPTLGDLGEGNDGFLSLAGVIYDVRAYWGIVDRWLNYTIKSRLLPPPRPEEGWQCNYCPLFGSQGECSAYDTITLDGALVQGDFNIEVDLADRLIREGGNP